MNLRLVILTEIIAPYRIPVFNVLASRTGLDLHVIFLAETDETLRQWHVYKNEICFSHNVLPSWRWRAGRSSFLINRGLWSALDKASPQVIICGGYNYVASWEALLWALWRIQLCRFLGSAPMGAPPPGCLCVVVGEQRPGRSSRTGVGGVPEGLFSEAL